jgi:hypothetical protein
MFTKYNRQKTGQARQTIGGKSFLVHRLAWEKAFGPIPKKLEVCHHCDVGDCVNLVHLFLGPHRINMEDMVTKGRQAKGERSGMAKLSRENVEAIRRASSTVHSVSTHGRQTEIVIGPTHSSLAKLYGVDESTISHILSEKTWKG